MASEKDKRDGDIYQLVTFSIGGEEFGVDILKVMEIIRTMEITKVPKAPEFVEGVINLRGTVIPIIDLRRRFGLEPKAVDTDTRIIVIRNQRHDSGLCGGFRIRGALYPRQYPWKPAPAVVPAGFGLYQRSGQAGGSSAHSA